jgi:lysozyme
MNINLPGKQLIKSFEACKLTAYKIGNDPWTIGWGATYYQDGRRIKKGDKITQQQADELFDFHLNVYCVEVKQVVKVPLNDNQFSALVSFAFNCGTDIDADTLPEGLGDSTLLKKVNKNSADITIRNEFMKWISKGTIFEKGLLRRRKAEADLYFTK